jgi:hypothetical protein
LALSDFLAKDEGGNNEVATAAAAATRINFLIMFIGFLPPREGPDHVRSWPMPPLKNNFSIKRSRKTNQEETNSPTDAIAALFDHLIVV